MDILDKFWEQGHIRSVDRHLARLLRVHFGGDETLSLLYALVSANTGEGHTCLDHNAIAELPFYRDYVRELSPLISEIPESPAIGGPGDYLPLIREGSRLYLHRYYQYEATIVRQLEARMVRLKEAPDPEELQHAMSSYGYFPEKCDKEIDWQRVAAAMAALNNFTVISGGPGTGKTTTVAKILSVLIRMGLVAPHKIAIAAPTGKAAVRLQEAIRKAKKNLDCDGIPDKTSTIHRLLGVIPGRPGFRHNRENLLAVDLVIVDEVSMIDVALMARLLEAVPLRAKLVLLGDKDQLASVNPGSVFGDLCGAEEIDGFSPETAGLLERATGFTLSSGNVPSIQDHIVGLRESYRYSADSSLGAIARQINAGQGEEALKVFKKQGAIDAACFPLAEIAEELGKLTGRYYCPYLRETELEKIFGAFNGFRIFSAVRQGPYGIDSINSHVEALLGQQGLIDPSGNPFYHGRPVIVVRNDYSVRLFNGDTGIILHDPDENKLMAFFLGADGGFRKFPPSRLPEHETAFALTVHKAQGSEYDHVAFVLPPGDVPVATRELVYTAITRARKSVTVFAEETSFNEAVARRARRMSGLQEMLRKSGRK
ncbi:MAG: exodeoxyribonuclease V subunit alpha [Pseudomonadota bacterium]